LQAATVKIKLRWSDFTTPTRQTTLPYPTDQQDTIQEVATQLLQQLWQDQQPVRLLGVGVSGLSPVRQLSLWDDNGEADRSVPKPSSDIGVPPQKSTTTEVPAKIEASAQTESHEGGHTTNVGFDVAKQQRIQQAMHILQERYGKPVVRQGIQDTNTE
jgi:DNA polymerase-4